MKLNLSFAWFGMYLVKKKHWTGITFDPSTLLVLFLMEMRTHYAC